MPRAGPLGAGVGADAGSIAGCGSTLGAGSVSPHCMVNHLMAGIGILICRIVSSLCYYYSTVWYWVNLCSSLQKRLYLFTLILNARATMGW